MLPPRRPLLTLLLTLATTLASLAALEIAFRIALPSPTSPPPQRVDHHLYDSAHPTPRPLGASPRRPFSAMVSTYSDDPRGYLDPGAKMVHRLNSRGYRDIEHPLTHPPETLRILGLGDSYLWGQGVRPEDRCLDILGATLESEGRWPKVETLNLAVSGSNSQDQLQILQVDGLPYQPDLVILHFVLNDIVGRDETGINLEFGHTDLQLAKAKSYTPGPSAFWNWMSRRYLRQVAARAYIATTLQGFDEDNLDWKVSLRAIEAMAALCDGEDIPFVVVIFPYFYHLDGDYPFQEVHEVVSSSLEAKGIPVIDLRDAFPGYAGPELWVHATDQHPNEVGHRLAAEGILKGLRALELVP